MAKIKLLDLDANLDNSSLFVELSEREEKVLYGGGIIFAGGAATGALGGLVTGESLTTNLLLGAVGGGGALGTAAALAAIGATGPIGWTAASLATPG